MIRTQIYLPVEQMKLLKEIAWKEDITLSETIRRLINEKVLEKKGREKKNPAGSWLLSLAKKAERLNFVGPKNLAVKMDKYLYG